MWMWILIGLIPTKANGYANGGPTESCESMAPNHVNRNGHVNVPQTTESPFGIYYTLGKEKEPITGT